MIVIDPRYQVCSLNHRKPSAIAIHFHLRSLRSEGGLLPTWWCILGVPAVAKVVVGGSIRIAIIVRIIGIRVVIACK